VRAVPVARKLSTIEEWREDQSCSFQRRYFRNESHSHEKSCVRVPMEMISAAVIIVYITVGLIGLILGLLIVFYAVFSDRPVIRFGTRSIGNNSL
jgi:hypothetical protein